MTCLLLFKDSFLQVTYNPMMHYNTEIYVLGMLKQFKYLGGPLVELFHTLTLLI